MESARDFTMDNNNMRQLLKSNKLMVDSYKLFDYEPHSEIERQIVYKTLEYNALV